MAPRQYNSSSQACSLSIITQDQQKTITILKMAYFSKPKINNNNNNNDRLTAFDPGQPG